MNRSTFFENYPRKFARKIAFILGRVQKPSEEPYKNEVWPVLAAEDHPDAPPRKRLRVNRYASAQLSRTRAVSMLPWGKRFDMYQQDHSNRCRNTMARSLFQIRIPDPQSVQEMH